MQLLLSKEEIKQYTLKDGSVKIPLGILMGKPALPSLNEHSVQPGDKINDRSFLVGDAKADICWINDLLGLPDAPSSGYAHTFYEKMPDNFRNIMLHAEFISKRDKDEHLTVCLIKGNISKQVYAKGFAKCSPEDTFNEFIGDVIALYRALKIEVPDKYFHIPNPEPNDFNVGDIIDTRGTGSLLHKAPIYKVHPAKRTYGDGAGFTFSNHCHILTIIDKNDYEFAIEEKDVKVIDDSNRYKQVSNDFLKA